MNRTALVAMCLIAAAIWIGWFYGAFDKKKRADLPPTSTVTVLWT